MMNEKIIEALQAQFGEEGVYGIGESHGILQVTTAVENIVPMIHFLYAHPVFKFQFSSKLYIQALECAGFRENRSHCPLWIVSWNRRCPT